MTSLDTRQWWATVVFVAGGLMANHALAVQQISAPQVAPGLIRVGAPTLLTITVQVAPDASLITNSPNLIRKDTSGGFSVISSLYDDGTHGDTVAGDGSYTVQIMVNEPQVGEVDLFVSAAYNNQIRRVSSPLTAVPAIGVPVVTILSPANNFITQSYQFQLAGLTSSNETVRIEGGASTVTKVADGNGNFTASIPLKTNQINHLFAIGIDQFESQTAPQSLDIIQDSQMPNLYIDYPTNGAQIAASAVEVAGRVGDLLSGFSGLTVSVNGLSANVSVGIGNNGSFDRPGIPLSLGANTISVTATDAAGNTVNKQVAVTRVPVTGPQMLVVSGNNQSTKVHSQLIKPIFVQIVDANGAPISNKLVTFNVIRSDGRLVADPNAGVPGTLMLQVHTDGSGMASAYWTLGGDAGMGNNRVSVTSKDVSGTILFCASANPGRASQINIASGNDQQAEASGPAPQKLRVWVNDSCNGIPGLNVTFSVQSGGGKVNGQDSASVPTDNTGHAEVDFTLGAYAGQNVVQADFPADPNSPATFVIYGLNRDTNKPTSFTGLVLDNASQPIGGAFCSLTLGATYLTTTSDTQGQFVFSNTPAGSGDLFISGASATSLGGNYITPNSFPFLSYSVVLVPNAENSLPKPVLLPQLNPTNNHTYYGTNDLVLTCDGIAGLKMTIKANSMHKADGSLVTPFNPAIVSLNQVKHDSVPMPIPDGAAPQFTWTLQPARSTFNPPVAVEYPNISGLPAGTIAYFLSFNHDTGKFEIIASGHVIDDGSLIVSDPESGLTLAGWGCNCPPYSVAGDCENCQESCSDNGSLSGGEITVPEKEVKAGGTIEFKIGEITDSGGNKQKVCGDGSVQDISVPPGEADVEWTITKPDSSTVSGSGLEASIVADHCGTYSFSYTASVDRDCAPAALSKSASAKQAASDWITGVEVGFDVPEGVTEKIGEVAGKLGKLVGELSVTASKKTRDCCDKTGTLFPDGESEISGSLKSELGKAEIPIPELGIIEKITIIFPFDLGGFEFEFKAGLIFSAAFEISGTLGERSSKCDEKDNCKFATVGAAVPVAFTLELAAKLCDENGKDCKGFEIDFAKAGSEFSAQVGWNVKSCDTGLSYCAKFGGVTFSMGIDIPLPLGLPNFKWSYSKTYHEEGVTLLGCN